MKLGGRAMSWCWGGHKTKNRTKRETNLTSSVLKTKRKPTYKCVGILCVLLFRSAAVRDPVCYVSSSAYNRGQKVVKDTYADLWNWYDLHQNAECAKANIHEVYFGGGVSATRALDSLGRPSEPMHYVCEPHRRCSDGPGAVSYEDRGGQGRMGKETGKEVQEESKIKVFFARNPKRLKKFK